VKSILFANLPLQFEKTRCRLVNIAARMKDSKIREIKPIVWAVLLFIVSGLLYFGIASSPALGDDDVDAAHAVVAREMVERHDYAVLYMNGIRYLVRAPLHFWMIASSYVVFGQTEFATRLPLALTVVALVLLVFEFGRKFFSPRVGLYGALIVATSPGIFIFTRTVNPEAICALEFSAAFYLFLRAWTGSLAPRAGYWGAAAFSAAAVLTRGLVGIIFPAGIIIAFVTATRSWRRWRELRPVSSLLIFLAVAAPWHIIAEIRAPGFFWSYFINDHVKRALGTRWPPDYSAVPLGLWWIAHLAWLFPWSFLAPLVVRDSLASRRREEQGDGRSQARLFLLLWAGFILVFFSIERGSRMEYYSLGAWPAIGLLLASALARSEQSNDRMLRAIQRVLAGLGIGVAILLGYLVRASYHLQATGDISTLLQRHRADYYRFAMAHFFDLTPQAFADLREPAMIAALALFAAFTAAFMLRERGLHLASSMVMALGMVGFLFAANLAYKAFEPELSSRSLAMEINRYVGPDDRLVVYGDFRASASVAFYTHRRLLLYKAPYSELEYGSRFPDAPKVFLNDHDFSALWRGHARVFLIVPVDQLQSALTWLPLNATWFLAESGAKVLYVNRPISPAQLPLGQAARQRKVPESHQPGLIQPSIASAESGHVGLGCASGLLSTGASCYAPCSCPVFLKECC
jgi:4-amino-4-deoxy-L-arabinose transferase-like glycosyltransferase